MTTINASTTAIQEERKFAEYTIIQFVKGSSTGDVYNMNYILHEDFRALLSESDLATVSKSEYMKMLSGKKLGAEQPQLEIMSLDMSVNTASAKIKSTYSDEVVEEYYHLVMEANGSWQILHVIPFRTSKI